MNCTLLKPNLKAWLQAVSSSLGRDVPQLQEPRPQQPSRQCPRQPQHNNQGGHH